VSVKEIYLARSDDGGASWIDVGKASTANSPWTRTFSNIQPNQGDYTALYANHLNLYAAWSDGRFGNPDILTLTVPLATTPTLVSLASAAADIGRVTLTWYAAAGVSEAYVYRREGDQWVPRGVVMPDGNRNLVYVDTDVDPGVRYEYRLGLREGSVEVFLGQVAVVVPTLDRLRLDGVHPNPTARDLWVSFSLPTSHPATLSVLDVAGRRVRFRDVGSLGRGRHLIELSEGRNLPAGMYVIRLEQDGRIESARASVVR